MTRQAFVTIDGKRYGYKDILDLRRVQLISLPSPERLLSFQLKT
jgi:hypothetical protein